MRKSWDIISLVLRFIRLAHALTVEKSIWIYKKELRELAKVQSPVVLFYVYITYSSPGFPK